MVSGTSSAMSTSNQYIKYQIAIVENSISIENNTSNVTVSVRFYRTNTGYTSYGTGTVYCYINGTTYTSSVTSNDKITNSGIVLFSKTLDIPHNNDGSKTLSTSAYISHEVVTSEGQAYYLDLTTIPRASELSVSSGTLGTAMTITATKKVSSFKHKVTWKCGGYSGTVCNINSGTSWSFTPELKLAEGAPNGTRVYCTFTLYTYNGSASVGSVTKAVWLEIPDTVVPTCSLFLEDVDGHTFKYGGYVQGQSRVHGEITANGAYGSKISSYLTDINSSEYFSSTFDSEVLLFSGDMAVYSVVKDTRGRTASANTAISVLPYDAPKITKLSVIRCNSDGTENDRGTWAKVTYSYSIESLNNRNSKGAVLKYKKSSETTWTSVTLTAVYSAEDQTSKFAADDAVSYDIALFISDDFYKDSTAVKSQTSVSTGYCLYHIPASGKGITFGGVAENDGFDVKMDAKFEGDSHFAGGLTEDIKTLVSGDCNAILTSGNYYIGTSGTNKPGSGWNGWLTVKSYGDAKYCYQEYVTYNGERYYRMRDNGTWQAWISRSPYPVGSIYISINSTSPATLFGGTWEQIKGRFLVGANTTYKAGSTGGEAKHTLTEDEMPQHNHVIYYPNGGGPDAGAAIGFPEAGSKNTWWAEGSKTGVAGSGAAHNNLPPYLAVYIWKRTA